MVDIPRAVAYIKNVRITQTLFTEIVTKIKLTENKNEFYIVSTAATLKKAKAEIKATYKLITRWANKEEAWLDIIDQYIPETKSLKFKVTEPLAMRITNVITMTRKNLLGEPLTTKEWKKLIKQFERQI